MLSVVHVVSDTLDSMVKHYQFVRKLEAPLTADLIESFAIRVALGNNGGTWAEHYTEPQREHWRQFVRDLVAEVCADIERAREQRRFVDGIPAPDDAFVAAAKSAVMQSGLSDETVETLHPSRPETKS
ncbi:MAG: hypothetical protein QOJ15_2387 [Bradyrhizobium sp.]|jgi:hypothetical protein|nr:hypothetical protein [Bradyrhizobium sp.]